MVKSDPVSGENHAGSPHRHQGAHQCAHRCAHRCIGWSCVVWSCVVLSCTAVAIIGCQLHEIAPFQDQYAAIVEIAPLGTPRDEVAKRLTQAGVKFSPSPGPEPGVFYCEIWDMETGERYYLFSELLFDSEGRLQEIRETDNNL